MEQAADSVINGKSSVFNLKDQKGVLPTSMCSMSSANCFQGSSVQLLLETHLSCSFSSNNVGVVILYAAHQTDAPNFDMVHCEWCLSTASCFISYSFGYIIDETIKGAVWPVWCSFDWGTINNINNNKFHSGDAVPGSAERAWTEPSLMLLFPPVLLLIRHVRGCEITQRFTFPWNRH